MLGKSLDGQVNIAGAPGVLGKVVTPKGICPLNKLPWGVSDLNVLFTIGKDLLVRSQFLYTHGT